MQINSSEISSFIKKQIEQSDFSPSVKNEGTIISVQDGVVLVVGLSDAIFGEQVQLPQNTLGLVLNLERDVVGIVVLGSYEHLKEGDKVHSTGKLMQTPVGSVLLGRVLNPLGKDLSGNDFECNEFEPIEKIAPSVIDRQSVDQPLQTGIKSIDSMVPIGRGQRELIIGDRQTGKTTIALDTIINQKNSGIKCIYVAIGQKNSSIANLVAKLKEHDAMKYTTIITTSAADSAALQFIAPYVGCTVGEYFRDRGEDALIIYDDLTKHAWSYRQISLLLRRPPGREAYPGDIFYLHSRLLERAARVSSTYVERMTKGSVKGKTGSLTALPIIETQGGDVSAFVPTNVISITDGQIFLESNLFNSGFRPAINAGLSVSRVGGAAQTKIIKKLGGGIRLSLAQYRELAAFSQFSSDLDEATRKQINRGQRVMELMKQDQYTPLNIAQMAIVLYAVTQGHLDDVDINTTRSFEKALLSFLSKDTAIFDRLEASDMSALGDLKPLIEDFKINF